MLVLRRQPLRLRRRRLPRLAAMHPALPVRAMHGRMDAAEARRTEGRTPQDRLRRDVVATVTGISPRARKRGTRPSSASRGRLRIYDRFAEWFASFEDAPPLVAEYRFAAPVRQWRFDFANLPSRVAIELEGGTWIAGRHNRGSSIEKDMEKYNTAAVLGWRLIRLTPGMLESDAERWRQAILDAIAGK